MDSSSPDTEWLGPFTFPTAQQVWSESLSSSRDSPRGRHNRNGLSAHPSSLPLPREEGLRTCHVSVPSAREAPGTQPWEEVSLDSRALTRELRAKEGRQGSPASGFLLHLQAQQWGQGRCRELGSCCLLSLGVPFARDCQPVALLLQCPKAVDKSSCQRSWAMVSTTEARKWIIRHPLNFNTVIAAVYKQCFNFLYPTSKLKQTTTQTNKQGDRWLLRGNWSTWFYFGSNFTFHRWESCCSSQGVSDFPKPHGQLECSSCCSFQPSVLPTCSQALQGSFGRVRREGNSGNPGPICEHP